MLTPGYSQRRPPHCWFCGRDPMIDRNRLSRLRFGPRTQRETARLLTNKALRRNVAVKRNGLLTAQRKTGFAKRAKRFPAARLLLLLGTTLVIVAAADGTMAAADGNASAQHRWQFSGTPAAARAGSAA